MKYFTMKDGSVMRESDLALIPPTEENADYAAFLADDSKIVEPFDYAAEEARQAKKVAPATVTMRQARLALLQSGLLDAVEAAVTGAGKAAQIEWEYSGEVHRDKALVRALTPALGLTEEQLDDLFELAASL